ALQHFLAAVADSPYNRPAMLGSDAVRYYQLLPGAPLTATELVRRLPPQADPGATPLLARISRDAQQGEQLTLYCGWEDFHQRTLGDRLYPTVVRQLRARGVSGPLRVAELELSGSF